MPAADTTHFYRHLPVISSFAEATSGRLHADVPDDWWVVVADITGSTEAIRTGAYKKVNTVGVACIAAVMNVERDTDLPYVFGGDGATFAVPERLRDQVVSALRAAQQLARESFGMALRAGLVRVSTLVAQGHRVRMGKLRLSPHVMQPVLSGRGWEEAERRVKAVRAADAMDVLLVEEDSGPAEASFDGFECRWQGVPSFNGHKLALLVAAMSPDLPSDLAIYRRVLSEIQAIYGNVEQYHPLRASALQMSFSPRMLAHEWRVRSGSMPPLRRVHYFLRLLFMNAAGSLLFALKVDTRQTRWTRYRPEMVENSDFRKFDGMLRMVIDGSDEQARRLEDFLDGEYRAGRLAFGMHKSREALVTCIVHSYNGRHQHFVDGGDGGYALAARELKRRLAGLQRGQPAAQATKDTGALNGSPPSAAPCE
ncbi:MAG TPA: DUF3095 domain-containing protein [Noviherbaspirillum sp.]